MLVLHCYVSDKHTLCFVFHVLYCYLSDKCTLCFVFDCNVIEKRTLNLYFFVTLVLRARCVLCFIVTFEISARYFCTLLLR